ncbi:MAG: hypothetical protein KF799_00235 [Bdellovibrionales bacterium]|nr:hypothetical protein [Bdellovibrionales bacterium]
MLPPPPNYILPTFQQPMPQVGLLGPRPLPFIMRAGPMMPMNPMGMNPMGQMNPMYPMYPIYPMLPLQQLPPPPQQQQNGIGSFLAMAAPLLFGGLGGSNGTFNLGGSSINEPCLDCSTPRRSMVERLPIENNQIVLPNRYAAAPEARTEAVSMQVPQRTAPLPSPPQQQQPTMVRSSLQVADRVAMSDEMEPEVQRPQPASPVERPVAVTKPKLGQPVKPVARPTPPPQTQVRRTAPDQKITPSQRRQVRLQTVTTSTKARGVPLLWNTLITKLAMCAPGCEPTGYNSGASHGHIRGSCHYSRRAIDIDGLRCGGKTVSKYSAFFTKVADCLHDKSFVGVRTKILHDRGNRAHRSPRGDHPHIHFSIGCNGGRTW